MKPLFFVTIVGQPIYFVIIYGETNVEFVRCHQCT